MSPLEVRERLAVGLEDVGDTRELPSRAPKGPWSVEVGSHDASHVCELSPGQRLTVGSGRGADLRVDDGTVSAAHCELRVSEDGVELVDQGSRNGCYLGGARIGRAVVTVREQTFVIGRSTLTIRVGGEVAGEATATPSIPGLIGGSAAMRRLSHEIQRLARLRAPVLIQGESGSGKDVVARALHRLGRPQGPYVALNVGTLSEHLAQSELFGHQRGAFTGAVSARPGVFVEADGGTLFLDEIADLRPELQVKLLRVVEDGRVRALGGGRELSVDVRIVSASWASLEERVRLAQFREDLFHRLGVFVVRVPALRERRGDLPALALHLLRRYEAELGPKALAPSALARLLPHPFPGNVRELASVLYRAAALSDTEWIEGHHIALATPGPLRVELSAADARRLLDDHRGNVSAAARAAGVARSTFRDWLSQQGQRLTPAQRASVGPPDRPGA